MELEGHTGEGHRHNPRHHGRELSGLPLPGAPQRLLTGICRVETTDTVFSSLMLLCSWMQAWLSILATFLHSLYRAQISCPWDTNVSRWNRGYFPSFLAHFHFSPTEPRWKRALFCQTCHLITEFKPQHFKNKPRPYREKQMKTRQICFAKRHILTEVCCQLSTSFFTLSSFKWFEIKSKL